MYCLDIEHIQLFIVYCIFLCLEVYVTSFGIKSLRNITIKVYVHCSTFQSNSYYKARFDPPKKEQKQRDKLSANIQKFLAKKDEEERQKKLEAQRKRDELLAMRDPKAMRKIQKSLKVIKSANKSVLADAVDHDNTAVTREGPDQPDQDDYGYESQEAAAIYEKMMQKYSKIPDEPKFPVGSKFVACK